MALQRGDIINYKRTGPISKLIRYLTKSEYSHTAVYLQNGLVIEAQWDGVNIRKMSQDPHDVFRHNYADKESLEWATIWMMNQVGAKYDYMGVLGMARSLLTGKPPTNLDSKVAFWCTELAIDGYHAAAITTGFDKETHLLFPGHIKGNVRYFHQVV